jgi:predicted dehydrogenase
MRFHIGVQAIRANLARIGRPMYFRGVFGHRLSQMRTTGGEFAREGAMGGGVVLDCIHEFDYLRLLFGPITDVRGMVTQIGEERIDAEDIAEVMFVHASGVHGTLHLDFLMRQKRRGIEVIGVDGTLSWFSTGKTPEVARVTFADQRGEIVLLDNVEVDPRQEYEVMLEHFLAGTGELQSVDEAIAALDAALKARSGTWP